jgi:hypothetical protein
MLGKNCTVEQIAAPSGYRLEAARVIKTKIGTIVTVNFYGVKNLVITIIEKRLDE